MNTSSQVSFLLESYFNDIKLSTATCFIWQDAKKQNYLISNWHVFSGCNSQTKKPIDEITASVPNKIAFYLPLQIFDEPVYLMHQKVELPLNSPDGVPLWFEHPDDSTIDVAALPLPEYPVVSGRTFYNISKLDTSYEVDGNLKIQSLYLALNQSPLIDDEYLVSASPVYVVGYPIGGRSILPLHKHAVIATEPAVSIENQPKMLLDTGTKKGMSGSPVLSCLGATYTQMDDQGKIGLPLAPTNYRLNFVGVYSGRIIEPKPDEFEKQIGICWRPETVDQIIDTKKRPLDL